MSAAARGAVCVRHTRPQCCANTRQLHARNLSSSIGVQWCSCSRRDGHLCRAAWFDKLRDKLSGDGPTLVPIDVDSDGGLGGTSDEVFGPLAVLLVGFLPDEYAQFQNLMLDMEADMVKIVPCSPAMLTGTLQQALEGPPGAYTPPALGQKRAVIVSGMYAAEVQDVIASYYDAGLPPTVFAAAVPNNYGANVLELVEEIYADDAYARQRVQSA